MSFQISCLPPLKNAIVQLCIARHKVTSSSTDPSDFNRSRRESRLAISDRSLSFSFLTFTEHTRYFPINYVAPPVIRSRVTSGPSDAAKAIASASRSDGVSSVEDRQRSLRDTRCGKLCCSMRARLRKCTRVCVRACSVRYAGGLSRAARVIYARSCHGQLDTVTTR